MVLIQNKVDMVDVEAYAQEEVVVEAYAQVEVVEAKNQVEAVDDVQEVGKILDSYNQLLLFYDILYE